MINYKVNRFKEVDIDLTNKCTLKCSMCARQSFEHPNQIPGGDASIEDLQKILDYFDFGNPFVSVSNIIIFIYL